MKQRTIAGKAQFSGRGVHTGVESNLSILPAKADTGILFRRIDKDVEIEANVENVLNNRRNTSLGKEDTVVNTVEHLMAALFGAGINNAVIEIDSIEVPILDGSASVFSQTIYDSGIEELDKESDIYTINETLEYDDGNTKAVISPSESFEVEVKLSYSNQSIPSRSCRYKRGDDFGVLNKARTFVFLSEVLPLMERNLIKGGSLNSAQVIKDVEIDENGKDYIARYFGLSRKKVEEKLRQLDTTAGQEICHHKLLDFLGDLYLLGEFLKLKVQIEKPGHRSNVNIADLIKSEWIKEN